MTTTTTTKTALISVFLNTWGNYNENGADGGFWVNLPCDLGETLEKLAKSTGEEVDEMEVFINDYETDIDGLEIGEYTDLEALNETAEELEALDEYDIKKLEAILEADGGSLEDALEKMDDYIFYSGQSLEDVAYEMIDEGVFGDIPDSIINYIDISAIARDLDYDGYTETENGVIYHC